MGTFPRRRFLQLAGVATGAVVLPLTCAQQALADTAVAPVLLGRQIRSVRIGEALQLNGNGFAAADLVSLWSIPDTGSLSSAGPTALPSTPPTGSSSLSLYGQTNDNLVSLVPSAVATAPYAVYVSSADHSTWSAPLLMNGPQPWYLDRSSVRAGQTVTAYGQNLSVGTSTPTVALGQGSTLTAATVTAHTAYATAFTVPSALAAGTYTVYLSNGLGGAYAFDRSLVLTVVAATGGTPLAINVVTGYGADPTGVANSTTALQNAFNAAAASSSGAIVTVPAGMYSIFGKLSLANSAGTILIQGSTSGTSTIRMADTATFSPSVPTTTTYDVYGVSAGDDLGMLYLAPGNGVVQIDHITFDANKLRPLILEIDGRHGATLSASTFINGDWPLNVYLYSGGLGVLAQSTRNLTVDGCVFIGSAGLFLISVIDQIIQNCTFMLWYARTPSDPANPAHQADEDGIKVWGARRLTIRGNIFERGSSTYYYARAVQLGAAKLQANVFGAAEAGGVEDVYIGENTVTGAGEPSSNNGETLIGDQFNSVTGGRVVLASSAASSATISTSAPTFAVSDDRLDAVGAYVVIVGGTGSGQIRRVTANTTTTLTVDAAWDILPTSGSQFVVQLMHARQIYHGNTLTACPKYLGIYGPSVFCIAADNHFDSTGAVATVPAVQGGIGFVSIVSGPGTGVVDLTFYDQVVDNILTNGHTFLEYQDFATSPSSTVPAAPLLRSNVLARNQVQNSTAAVQLETPYGLASAPGTMGRYNMSIINTAGSGVTDNTTVDGPWDRTVYQGPSTGIVNGGTNTVWV